MFARPKAVGLPRLKDSLLVLTNCSSLSVRQREDLFMSSRDRLSKKPIRYKIEDEIELLLRTNPELKKLQQQRRDQDVQSKLSEEKPLEEVLNKVLKASPTLKTLFLKGQRLAKPFARAGGHVDGSGGGPEKGAKPFHGRKHPTYFRIENTEYGKTYTRNCELGRRCRIKFETDVENGYFDRAVDRGSFELEIAEADREMLPPSYNLVIEDGEAHLNMALPEEAKVGDCITLMVTVNDSTLREPFVNVIRLKALKKQTHQEGTKNARQKRRGQGSGSQKSEQGIALPRVIPVHENDKNWVKYKFEGNTASHVISDPIEIDGKQHLEHIFYINIDNTSLLTEMKYSKQDARLLVAKFKYGNVLLGLAMLHEEEQGNKGKGNETAENENEISIQDNIRRTTTAVAPVLLPMIDQLSGLREDDMEAFGDIGDN